MINNAFWLLNSTNEYAKGECLPEMTQKVFSTVIPHLDSRMCSILKCTETYRPQTSIPSRLDTKIDRHQKSWKGSSARTMQQSINSFLTDVLIIMAQFNWKPITRLSIIWFSAVGDDVATAGRSLSHKRAGVSQMAKGDLSADGTPKSTSGMPLKRFRQLLSPFWQIIC